MLTTCCYTDGVFSKGMGRISTEFSAMPDVSLNNYGNGTVCLLT
jgi:hypothetical protein